MSLKITYLSENGKDYVDLIKKCKSLDELKKIVTEYKELAEDAYQKTMQLSNEEFSEFISGRDKRKPSEKWIEEYGMILLPRTILEAGLIAVECHVPFGCAYIRMKEFRDEES